ncbi:hypothetical protein MRGA327_21585 [Mycobacterium tuberculosis RGTB327]|nr:hypothetical protein MRGA327_21585 [Mycobacterium tuberculosis RGTB327]
MRWLHFTAFGSPLVPEVKISDEKVCEIRGSKTHLGIPVCGHLVGPFGGVDIDVLDIGRYLRRSRAGEHQLAVGFSDVAGQCRAAAHRVEAHRDDPRQRAGHQCRREERRVLQ